MERERRLFMSCHGNLIFIWSSSELKNCLKNQAIWYLSNIFSSIIQNRFFGGFKQLHLSILGPRHTPHFRTQYCDITIKRHFSPNIFLLCELKIFFWARTCLFEMHHQYLDKNNIFYHNVFLSQYCGQKCCVWQGP